MCFYLIAVTLLPFAVAWADTTVQCRSGRELVAAFADSSVRVALIPVNLAMAEGDWAPYPTPLELDRNLTFMGAFDSPEAWPLLDLGYVPGKVRLGVGVVLAFSRLVITGVNQGPLFQGPGFDLLVTSAPGNADAGWPVLMVKDGALVHRACLPTAELRSTSVATMPRHPVGAGAGAAQLAVTELPQPGCVNSSSSSNGTAATAMQLCWPLRGCYIDVATYGFDWNVVGKPAIGNYAVWVINVTYLCQTVMDEECAMRLGAVGCFYSLVPKQALPPSLPAAPLDAHRPEAAKSSDWRRRVLAPVLGGVLGGVLLFALLAAAAVTVRGAVIARRRSSQAANAHEKPPSGWGNASAAVGFVTLVVDPLPVEPGTSGEHELHSEFSSGLERQPSKPPAGPEGAPLSSLGLTCLHSFRDDHPLVTPRTPLLPGIPLDVRLGGGPGEVQLLPVTRGKGACGRVVEGVYGGARVAVKLIDTVWEAPRAHHTLSVPTAAGAPAVPAAGGSACRATEAPVGKSRCVSEPRLLASGAQTHCPQRGSIEGSAPMLRGQSSVSGGSAESSAQTRVPRPPTCVQAPTLSAPPCGWEESSGGRQVAAAAAALCGSPVRGAGGSAHERCRVVGQEAAEHAAEGTHGAEPWIRAAVVGTDAAGAADAAGGGGGGKERRNNSDDEEEQGEEGETGSSVSGNSVELALAQEVEVLARCDHPHVVRLLAANLRPPTLCLVMELMDTSLDRLLYGAGPGAQPLPLHTVLHIGIQVAQALAYLHPTILHRDLKPANVLISRAESNYPIAKMADFGLSRLRDTVLVTRNPEVGTAAYIAPECFDLGTEAITDRADIYSFGVILWEMLSGQRPWEERTVVQIAFTVSMQRLRLPLDGLPPDRCPPKLRSLIADCWQQDPARRPAAEEVAKRLALVQQGLQLSGSASGGLSPRSSSQARSRLLLPAVMEAAERSEAGTRSGGGGGYDCGPEVAADRAGAVS